jgi:hypothetical protein
MSRSMPPLVRTAFTLAGLVTALAACSAAARSDGGAPLGDGGSTSASPAGDITDPTATVAKLHGVVLAPEGTIPIGGAVVALFESEPAPLEPGLRCDKCITLSRDVPFATSGPDGRFELSAPKTGHFFLAVQKGTFRRVRALDVIRGEQDVPAVMTTLPAKTDAAKGDVIPKMALVLGQWDHVELSLAKLGLGKLVADEVDRASLPYDVYDDPSPAGLKSGARLLSDPALLSKYQIVLLPCRGSSGTTCDDTTSTSPAVQSALRGFVEGGGRVYVTDYSYEFVRQLWPEAVTWAGESANLGSACSSTSYDAPGRVDDPGLSEWLGAIGHQSVTLEASWTTIDAVHEADAIDADGQPTKNTPKVWMSAEKPDGAHPATVSFERGCGRVLFSTYHTAGAARDPLRPQEKALLYVLLELGVCVEVQSPK